MNDDYVEAFVRESEENIVDLNNSLLALEDDPTDREAIDLIFRTAHTLKGNFAAMGYANASELAHAMEDLLDEIRQGRVEVTPEVMDHVFAGVDELEAAVSEIERAGETTLDATAVVDDLRAVAETTATDGRGDGNTAAGRQPAPSDLSALVAGGLDDLARAVDDRLYLVHVGVVDGDMKGVDGMLVLEAITGAFELHGSVPPREEIEDGAYEDGFDLLLEAGTGADLDAFFEDISKVESARVEEVTASVGRATADDASPDPEGGEATKPDRSADVIKSVRVDVGQLDDLYSLVEQLVTSRIKLRRSIGAADYRAASDNLDELDKITANLQDTVMDMRLIPLRKVVNTFPRLVRDLARGQDKGVNFTMEGTDVELDRTILDEISDPLMHVLRNAVDHGIESPDARESAGKPRDGSIRLSASRERDHVDVVVEDDGAGLDPDAIRRKAIETGVKSEAELAEMDDDAVYDLVFHPGVTTSEEVTDVSGRGVGMDVVQDTVDRLDGSVSVSSEPGEGTAVTLRLPITVAIVRVLFIEVAGRVFGLPIKDVDEITAVGGIETINGRPVVDHDGSVYPVIDLRERLSDAGPSENGDGMLLRIRESERPVALRCDAVDRQEEVVTKPFEGVLRDVPGMSGTAVVGDGQVVPIIDVVTL